MTRKLDKILKFIFVFLLIGIPIACTAFFISDAAKSGCFGRREYNMNCRGVDVCYGIDQRFENTNGTCAFTLKEVVVADSLRYGEQTYTGRGDHFLVVKADVEFFDYTFTKCEVCVEPSDMGQQYYYSINKSAFTDENTDLLLDVCTAVNPEVSFRGEKQTFSGTVYLCMDLEPFMYFYMKKQQETPTVSMNEHNIEFHIDEMVIEPSAELREKGVVSISPYITCTFADVVFTDVYTI